MSDAADPRAPAGRAQRGRPRNWNDTTDQNTIKSLDRAIAVLQALGEMGGATLSELAGHMGEAPATIYRVLVTFQARGFVDFDDQLQVWNVGAGAFLAGSTYLRRTSLVERARPIMRDLMETTGETANLGIARGDQVMFLGQVETHATIRAFFPPGTLSAMHASGIGKALLAHMPQDRLARLMRGQIRERFTAATLTAADDLLADLARTRAEGYAYDAEERHAGMRCIAAPVFDLYGEAVAGLSVSGPSTRISDAAVPDLARAVMRAARDLTRAIGGTAP